MMCTLVRPLFGVFNTNFMYLSKKIKNAVPHVSIQLELVSQPIPDQNNTHVSMVGLLAKLNSSFLPNRFGGPF